VYGRSDVVEGGAMEFLILGPLEVRNGEETVRLGAAKQRALLGVLLLHANETVSTSRLVDELWGERPPATAEKLVQGYVHALRKQLGDGVLETQAPGYRLKVEPRSLDLAEFERLTDEARRAPAAHAVELRRRALALWRGPPLGDVVLEGADRHALGRLAELRLTTQIECIEAELQLGRHSQLVGELEALVAEHPYQERAAGLLMLALYRSGRQAEALEVYRTVRRRLSEELGLEPGQELRELEAAVLRQDDALAAPVAVREAAPVAEAAPVTAEPTVTPTRGRRRRLAAGGVLALVAIAAVAIAVLVLRDEPAPVVVPPNSVAVIDVDTNRVDVDSIVAVGNRPGPVAEGAGYVWVGNLDDPSLTRIDPSTHEREFVSLEVTPDAVTAGAGAAFVVNGGLGTLYRVDAESRIVSERRLSQRSHKYQGAGVDIGEQSVWAAVGDGWLARVAPETLEGEARLSEAAGPTVLVFANGWLWVATERAEVQLYSPETWDLGQPVDGSTVCRSPSGMAAGQGAIWVVCRDDGLVWRMPADLNFDSARPIEVGDGPTAVAFGAGAVWVANTSDGTVSRIDPETYDVETIEVGNAPAGIDVSGEGVWVSVQAPPTS
jgi:DNA-binding SARP family transcriptional activator/streptogramin lyase